MPKKKVTHAISFNRSWLVFGLDEYEVQKATLKQRRVGKKGILFFLIY